MTTHGGPDWNAPVDRAAAAVPVECLTCGTTVVPAGDVVERLRSAVAAVEKLCENTMRRDRLNADRSFVEVSLIRAALNPEAVHVEVNTDPPKPPYGSPERETFDARQALADAKKWDPDDAGVVERVARAIYRADRPASDTTGPVGKVYRDLARAALAAMPAQPSQDATGGVSGSGEGDSAREGGSEAEVRSEAEWLKELREAAADPPVDGWLLVAVDNRMNELMRVGGEQRG